MYFRPLEISRFRLVKGGRIIRPFIGRSIGKNKRRPLGRGSNAVFTVRRGSPADGSPCTRSFRDPLARASCIQRIVLREFTRRVCEFRTGFGFAPPSCPVTVVLLAAVPSIRRRVFLRGCVCGRGRSYARRNSPSFRPAPPPVCADRAMHTNSEVRRRGVAGGSFSDAFTAVAYSRIGGDRSPS